MTLATGGSVSDVNISGTTYRVHTFTGGGALVVTEAGPIEYLLIGGGGGGGARGGGGGGGAGGLLQGSTSISSGSFTVTIGNGGTGAPSTASGQGGDGGASTFNGLSATGGGGGGASWTLSANAAARGRVGGSGGGAGLVDASNAANNVAGTGVSGQGSAGGLSASGSTGGGTAAGGGGGAGGVGGNAVTTTKGDRGAGVSSSITGVSVLYAEGGEGGRSINAAGSGGRAGCSSTAPSLLAGVSAPANTGAGGGGSGGAGSAAPGAGGNGGSGILIVSYALTAATSLNANNITAGAPVIGAPGLNLAGVSGLTASDITIGAPVMGAPALTIIVNLIATGITAGAGSTGNPKLVEFWAWPFRPLPDSAEALSWATDVMRSGTSEMRVSLRPARQALTYGYNLRDPRNARAEAVLRAAPRAMFRVPIWHEGTDVGAVSAIATTITVDTNADYRVGAPAMVWGGCDDFLIAEVASIGAGSITFSAAIGRAFTSARVMPLRACFMGDGGLRADRIRERGVSTASITFVSTDEPPSPAAPFVQYLGLDLVSKCGTVETLASSFVPSTAFIDSGLGPIALEALRDPIDARFTMVWRMAGLAKLWERRRWLHLIRGRDRAFWLTDWQRDLTLQAAIGPASTTILVAPLLPRVADYVGRHVLIDDGTETPRQITAAAQSGLNHQLTIAAVGRTVPTTARVSFLRKVRLDSDVVEFAHRHGFFSATRLPLIEVPE